MNYKLIAIGIILASPFVASVGSHVSQMGAKPAQNMAPPVLEPQQVTATPVTAPPAPVASAPPSALGEANPLAGQPMLDTGDAAMSSPPPPPPQPSGILPPYPGQFRGPSQGTVHLPDGQKIG